MNRLLQALFFFITFVMLTAFPAAASVREYYTVQAGSFPTRAMAETGYDRLVSRLPAHLRAALRVEVVDGYFTVRLGRFEHLRETGQVLAAAREVFPDSLVLQAFILPERIARSYDSMPAGDAIAPIFQETGSKEEGPGTRKSGLPEAAPADTDRREVVPPSQGPVEDMAFFDGGDVQMDLIRARILSRFGRYEESLALYRKLRRQYPGNLDIWEDYIETLINYEDFELALSELQELYRVNPSRLRANRLEARIYIELETPRLTYDIYENLLLTNPRDGGIWADYGNARLAAGDWQTALDYYCRVLELDADNQAVIRSVHGILKEHRPRLETGYRIYNQADDTETAAYSVNVRRHLGTKNLLELLYDRISINRPAGAAAGLDLSLEKPGIILHHQYDQQWRARAGLSPYSGLGDGSVTMLGLDYTGKRYGVSAVHERHNPWYDEPAAAALDGSYDRSGLVVERSLDRNWYLNLDLGYREYYLYSCQDYGKKRSLTAILTRKLFERPDLSVSYTFSRSLFDYEDETVQTVPMLISEAVHSLTGIFEYWPCTYWGAYIYGGFRQDVVRKVDAWVFLPGIRLRLGNRITGELNYEYLTEAGNVAGGRSTTINLRLNAIF